MVELVWQELAADLPLDLLRVMVSVTLEDLPKVGILLDLELGEELIAVLKLGRVVGREAILRHGLQ